MAIDREMEKEKPREDVVLPLMKTTYSYRRKDMLHNQKSVTLKLETYPALKTLSVIEQELDLVLCKQSVHRSFVEEYTRKWAPAIFEYCRKIKRKDIKDIIEQEGDDVSKCALKLLYCLLCVQPKKKATAPNFESLYQEYEMTDDPEVVALMPSSGNPRIGRFAPEDGTEMYFIFVEQLVLCKAQSLERALFIWFSLFYIFDLEYTKEAKEVCLFVQEFLHGMPDNAFTKTLTYISVTIDIQSLTLR